MIRRLLTAAGLTTALVVVPAASAWAHVEIDPAEAPAGSTQVLTITVAYEGSPTIGLDMQLPEGTSIVSVAPKDGWSGAVDEGEGTISWTGGPVADDVSFEVEVVLPSTPGEVLFPAIQLTEAGEVAWISEEEGEGHDNNPAPRMTLTADPAATTSTTTTTTTTEPSTPSTTEGLPGTTLEAEDRDDGTSPAPWLIGSGVAAAVAVGVGGLLLKRRAG